MPISLLGLPFLLSTNLIGAYYFPNGNSGWGGVEAKAIYKISTKQKMFEARHPLLKDNNVILSTWGEFSPVSLNAGANTSWEIVPFAKLNVGGSAETRERRHFAQREYERPQTRPYRLALNWEAQL
jgi:hypothetical protein